MFNLRYANKNDISFVLQGIFEICAIEKQKKDSLAVALKLITDALRKKEIRIITDDDVIVGFIQFAFTKKNPYGLKYGDYERKYCWVDNMYVAKKFRKMGIGEMLLKDVRVICKKEKISEIMLDVFHVNKKARAFYEEEGFSEFIHILRQKIK